MRRAPAQPDPHKPPAQEPRQDGTRSTAAAGLPGKTEVGQAAALRRLQPPSPLAANARRNAVAVAVRGRVHTAPVQGLRPGPGAWGGRATRTCPRGATGPASDPCCQPPRGAEKQPPGPWACGAPHLRGGLPCSPGGHQTLGHLESCHGRPPRPAQRRGPRVEPRGPYHRPCVRDTQQHALGRFTIGCPLFTASPCICHPRTPVLLHPCFHPIWTAFKVKNPKVRGSRSSFLELEWRQEWPVLYPIQPVKDIKKLWCQHGVLDTRVQAYLPDGRTCGRGLLFSFWGVYSFLWCHGLQQAMLLWPVPSPGVCSKSCPLSWRSYLTISSSAAIFSFCVQSFPAPGSFPVSPLFAPGDQSIGASTSASVLPLNIQGWFTLGSTVWISLMSKGLSRVLSSLSIWKHLFFTALPSLWSNSYICTWLPEKPYLWLYGPFSAKRSLCFLIPYLGLS